MDETADYGERYCAFVDILGFKALIDELETGDTRWKVVKDILHTIYQPVRGELDYGQGFAGQRIG